MTIFLVDLSNHDWGRGPVSLESMRAAGIEAMVHKATDGPWFYQDPYIGEALRRAREAGVVPGAYHVLWNNNVQLQMDWFLSVLDDVAPWWRPGPFLLQLDCEPFGYNGSAPTLDTIKTASDYLKAKTGWLPLVYAPKWVYGDTLGGLDVPLWSSHYGANPTGNYVNIYPGDNSSRWNGYSGLDPTLLQYGSRANVGSQSGCDVNAFRGSLGELLHILGHETTAERDVTVRMYKPCKSTHPEVFLLTHHGISVVRGAPDPDAPREASQFEALLAAGVPYKEDDLPADSGVWFYYADHANKGTL